MQKIRPIGEAVIFLHTHIRDIHSVSEWARTAGYSRAYFSVLISRRYGKTPYEIIKQAKFRKVKQLICKNPGMKGKAIARRAGFDNVKSLYKFLRRDFHTNLTNLRKREY